MPIDAGTAVLEVDADLDRAARRLDNEVPGTFGKLGDKAQSSFMGTFGKLAVGIGGLFAGIGLANFGKSILDASSDIGESVSKNTVLFGDWVEGVDEMSKSSAEAMGISRRAFLDATGTFGGLFRAMELGQKDSANMSADLVQLAADMASFNNASPEDVLLALRSGLVGEAEPLRKFGVQLSAARIEAEAMALGLEKVDGEFTAGAKAQAAYSIIMKDTALAQGDFARTSEGAANRQRILAARVDDLKAALGDRLMPVWQGVLTFLLDTAIPGLQDFGRVIEDDVVPWIRDNLVPIFQRFGEIIVGDVWPALQGLFSFIVDNQPVWIGILAALGAVFLVWAINAGLAAAATLLAMAPLIALAAAVGIVVAAVIYAYQEWGWFQAAVDAVAGFITGTLVPAFQAMVGFLTEHVIPIVAQVAEVYISIHAAIFDKALVALSWFVGFVNEYVLPVLATLWSWVDDIGDIFVTAFEAAKTVVETVATFIIGRINDIIGPIENAIGKLETLANLGGGDVKEVGSQGFYDEEVRQGRDLDRDSHIGRPPGRAGGGPVRMGNPYFVGEQGIELFVPNESGYIVPNHTLNKMGNTYQLNLSTMSSEVDVMGQFRRMELIGDYAVTG